MNTSMEYFPVVVYAVAFFVGPVVLAVTYTLLQAWVDDGDAGRHGPRTEEGS